MLQKNQNQLKWVGIAFAMLVAVSLYRLLSAQFFANDPFRPVLTLFVYVLALTIWYSSIHARMAKGSMRFFLLAEHAIMLFWIVTRFIQDAILHTNMLLMRVSGYLISLPFVLFPLFGLYAALCLGKSEEYRIKKPWYLLLAPALLLSALMLTNESHRFVFRLLSGEAHANLYFHPNVGLYIIIAWAAFLEFARLVLIYFRSREIWENSRFRALPLIIAAVMLAFIVPYVQSSFVSNFELIEFSAAMFFLEAMVWESCIFLGMVPVNSHYEDVFDCATVAMQIVNKDGQLFLKSANAKALQPNVFEQLRKDASLKANDGTILNLHAINGGFAVWQSDVSKTLAVIDSLEKSAEKLKAEGELIRQELKTRSDEEAVKAQHRIYNQLTSEVKGQLALIQSLLAKQENTQDKAALFYDICLVGTYIKRRCNLRLIEQSDGEISNNELTLCYKEIFACLKQMNIGAEISWNTERNLCPEFAIFTLDMLELVLEHEGFAPKDMKLVFGENACFSLEVKTERGTKKDALMCKLEDINKNQFDISCQQMGKTYQLFAKGATSGVVRL